MNWDCSEHCSEMQIMLFECGGCRRCHHQHSFRASPYWQPDTGPQPQTHQQALQVLGMLSPSDHHTTFSTFCHSHNTKCHFKCIFEDNWLSSIVITSYRCTAQDIFSSIFTLVLIEQRLQSIIRFWMDHLSKCFCFFTQVLIKTKSLHILHTFTQTSNAK